MSEDDKELEAPKGLGAFPYDGWDKPSRTLKPDKNYSPHYKGDNSGGFGNPPISGQRKRGDKGGPGRPKGHTSLQAALRRAFRRKLPIVRDGKVTKLHPADILAERIVEAMLAKNLSHPMIELARRLMDQYGPQVPVDDKPKCSSAGFSREEKGILSAMLGRYLGDTPGETRRHVLGTVCEPYPTGEFVIFKRDDGHIGFERTASEPRSDKMARGEH